jgi:RimJ/RimL family protein N-acetyltransferase
VEWEHPAELRTDRLRLRPYRPADFEMLFRELVLDPTVIRFWHAYGSSELTDDDRRAMAEHDLGSWIEEGIAAGYPTWVIEAAGPAGEAAGGLVGEAPGATGQPPGAAGEAPDAAAGPVGDFVGAIGVYPAENEWGPEPEVGYMLASRHHGRGLATEALRAVIADATERLRIPVLVGIVDEPNGASIRVLEKCGFALDRSYVGRDGHPYRRYVRTATPRRG